MISITVRGHISIRVRQHVSNRLCNYSLLYEIFHAYVRLFRFVGWTILVAELRAILTTHMVRRLAPLTHLLRVVRVQKTEQVFSGATTMLLVARFYGYGQLDSHF